MNGETPLPQGALPHEEAIGLLDALRDGELEADEAARVQAHLDGCERCRRVEAALGGSLRAAVAKVEAQPPDLLAGVQRKLHLRSRGRFYREEGKRRTGLSPWPLVVASMLVLLALAASYVLLGQVGGATTAPAPSTPANHAAP